MSALCPTDDRESAVCGTALEPTRSAGTLEQYRGRGQALLSCYMRERGLTPGGGESYPDDFAFWLAEQRPELCPATWRLYRQAALYLIEGWPDADLEVVANILAEAVAPSARPKPLTSARKQKRLPEEHFRLLLHHLQRVGTTGAAWETRDWLIAGVATGLRPGEWRRAALIQNDDRTLLAFVREKTTNARSLGEHAVLDVSALGRTEREAIRRMTERGQAWHALRQYAPKQEACGQLLRVACKSLWPRTARGYCLYSCRHQATANFKAALSSQEVAAILGHAVTDTMMSYGKRRVAWSVDSRFPPPVPMPGDVDLVRLTRRTFRSARDSTSSRGSPGVTQSPL